MMNYTEMKTKNGYYEYDGKVYVLIKPAYRTGTNKNPRFDAPAVIEGSNVDEDG